MACVHPGNSKTRWKSKRTIQSFILNLTIAKPVSWFWGTTPYIWRWVVCNIGLPCPATYSKGDATCNSNRNTSPFAPHPQQKYANLPLIAVNSHTSSPASIYLCVHLLYLFGTVFVSPLCTVSNTTGPCCLIGAFMGYHNINKNRENWQAEDGELMHWQAKWLVQGHTKSVERRRTEPSYPEFQCRA